MSIEYAALGCTELFSNQRVYDLANNEVCLPDRCAEQPFLSELPLFLADYTTTGTVEIIGNRVGLQGDPATLETPEFQLCEGINYAVNVDYSIVHDALNFPDFDGSCPDASVQVVRDGVVVAAETLEAEGDGVQLRVNLAEEGAYTVRVTHESEECITLVCGIEVNALARRAVGGSVPTIRLCGCGDTVVGTGGPRNHTIYDAPWYDPDDDASLDFYGLYVLEMRGFDDSPYEREVYDNVFEGAVLGRLRKKARRWTVRGLLVGRTCCGNAYGLRWLSSVLRGDVCKSGCSCEGDEWTTYACCPDIPEGATDREIEEAFEAEKRTLLDVAVERGPRVTRCLKSNTCGSCGTTACGLREVEFDMVAGTPYLFREPCEMFSGGFQPALTSCVTWVKKPNDPAEDCRTVDEILASGERIEWTESGEVGCDGSTEPCGQELCPQSTCGSDPCIAEPPVRAPAIVVCSTGPSCVAVARNEQCFTIPCDGLDTWQTAVPVIGLYAGDTDLKDVKIAFRPNPFGLAPSELDDCDVCNEITVPFVAAGNTLIIDGRTRSANVECSGICAPARSLYAQGFEWPEMHCPDPITVCVSTSNSVATNATLSVEMVVREA